MLDKCELTFNDINTFTDIELYDILMSGKIYVDHSNPIIQCRDYREIELDTIEDQENFFTLFYMQMCRHMGIDITMADEPECNYNEIAEYIDSMNDKVIVCGKEYKMSDFLWRMDMEEYKNYVRMYLNVEFICLLEELVKQKKVTFHIGNGIITYTFEEGDNYDNIYRV